MDFKTIRTNLITALKNDSDISTLCTTNFGKAASIFNALDERNPPDLSASPLILVLSGRRRRDDGTNYYERELRLVCSVAEDGITVSGGVHTYGGADILDDFSELVERKATLHLMGSGVSWRQVLDNEDLLVFPWFSCCWTYLVMVRNLL